MLENNINLRKRYVLRKETFSLRCFNIAEIQAWEDNNTYRLSNLQRRHEKWKVR